MEVIYLIENKGTQKKKKKMRDQFTFIYTINIIILVFFHKYNNISFTSYSCEERN